MKEIKSLTGKWKGEFTLGVEYGEAVGETIYFELNLIDINGTFSGTCMDAETRNIFTEPITVKGFWNQEIISFIKQYPFLYYNNEKGEIIVDKTKKHPEINYTGHYNKLLNIFEGDFELLEGSIDLHNGDFLESLVTGTWKMKRSED